MQFLLVESCSDDSYHACGFSPGLPDLAFARHIVEFEPSAISVFYDALCSDDFAALIQTVDDIFELGPGVFVACLSADLIEYLIGIVAVVVMMVMVMSAFAFMVVVMVMLMMMLAMFMLIVVIVMVVMMVALMLLFIIVMMVMMMVLMFMFMVMLVLMGFEFLVSLFSELVELGVQSLIRLHDLKHLGARQLIPVSRHDLRGLVERPDVLYYLIEFGRSHALLMRKEDGACVLYLILKELAEVLHVHLVSLGIDYCRKSVELDLVILKILHGDDDVG